MTGTALFSVHDVTPDSLPRVRDLVDLVEEAGHRPPLLLVVAGRAWTEHHLSELRVLQARGCRLAGHGWSHEAPAPTSLRHRIHARILSRDEAEHLSRSRDDVRERVRRCHAWFARHDLAVSPIYVPPAWALGPLTREDLDELPFRYYSTLTGLVDGATGRKVRLPLVGFEADTRTRRRALRVSNALNLSIGRWTGRPVRIGYHPTDLELLLGEDARRIARRPWRCVEVEDVF
ncbi:MAG: DUF2334 domain-containing protein [Gemmatimonadota bacterium]